MTDRSDFYTVKHKMAIRLALTLDDFPAAARLSPNPNALYQELSNRGFVWDRVAHEWVRTIDAQPSPVGFTVGYGVTETGQPAIQINLQSMNWTVWLSPEAAAHLADTLLAAVAIVAVNGGNPHHDAN